ncbi:MAG: energy transducer TonB [Flavobacteriia bacterium]|nr:energy transducer TonB [Flavobacteriia bacterium]
MKARIPSPCPANWDDMKIKVNSRHCAQCDKDVMDFTQMRREEIIRFLILHSQENVCGRLNRGQVDFHEEEIAAAVRSYISKNPNTNRAFFVLAIGAMFMASCSPPGSKYQGPPETNIVTDTATTDTTALKVDTVCAKDVDSTLPANIPVPGEIELIVEGEVAIEYPIDTNEVIENAEAYNSTQPDTNLIYEFVDQFPEFEGGADSLFSFINNNFEIPEAAVEMGLEGRIYVRFIINRDGSVENPEIVRGIGNDQLFERPVEKLFSTMPKWKPGMKDGRIVRCYYHLPLRIKLPEPLEPTQGGVPQ